MAIIEAEGLTKVYVDGDNETPVLKGVDLKVEKGEFVALMGPSGSGKSTLLHILGLLDNQTDGVYQFDGNITTDFEEDEIARIRNKKIGFIFQSFNLLAKTSVLENVKLPLLYSELPQPEWNDRALKAIEAVGLSHRINNLSSDLSGGEKQRVAIARALIHEPEVIFADEPTGNLDSKSGSGVMEIIQKLHEEKGHTIMLITHETTTAEHAERIVRIHDGVVVNDEKVVNRRRGAAQFMK
jgi:putative ABC transport system ATP-binding protein